VMKRIILLCILIYMLTGCASTPKIPLTVGPVLPDRPNPVVIDNGKVDTKKFPNTKWIKEPKLDLNKGIACWSNKDVEAISDSLVEHNLWADTVEETLRKFNATLKGGDHNKDLVPWYKKIF
jgi:hypothetical protein